MDFCGIKEIEEYYKLLKQKPEEVKALFRNLLITVTSFFRDKEAFKELEDKIIPEILENKKHNDIIRVWIPGCSTGDEAYSIAILLHEYAQKTGKRYNFQIFATDVEESSIEIARSGIYSKNAVENISLERLNKFFIKKLDCFQIRKKIRESIIFSTQNLILDPPFSKLDLISCRNLLIYLKTEVQKKLIILFHFVLKPDGFLNLGSSENIGRRTDLFGSLSKKWKIYKKIGTARIDQVNFPIASKEKNLFYGQRNYDIQKKFCPEELTKNYLLQIYCPASVLVNKKYEALYFRGPVSKYLEHQTGTPTNNLIFLTKEGIGPKLRGAIHKTFSRKEKVILDTARVKRGDNYFPVKITVYPLSQGLALVTFEESKRVATEKKKIEKEESFIKHLENELAATKEDLQGTIEALETSNEELKALNEEVMSMNEELQLTNEELETSKEELQSLNEELNTVNIQLQEKLIELETKNNDIKNLLDNTDIAIMFLDKELKVKKFTKKIKDIFNLIESDVGRPITDIAYDLTDFDIQKCSEEVISEGKSIEKNIKSKNDKWYIIKILPYNTAENIIEGVVITFTDIYNLKRTEFALKKSEEKFRELYNTMSNGVFIYEPVEGEKFLIKDMNLSGERIVRVKKENVLGRSVTEVFPAVKDMGLLDLFVDVYKTGKSRFLPARYYSDDKISLWAENYVYKLSTGEIVAVFEDITQRKKIEMKLQKSLNEKEVLLKEIHHRVKNNLQMVSSLIELQLLNIEDEEIVSHIKDTKSRIRAMAVVHKLLYETDNLDRINLRNYLKDVGNYLEKSYKKQEIELKINAENLFLNINSSIPASLIINELISNAYKHAFPLGTGGYIEVKLYKSNGSYVITVEDNGIDFPEDMNVDELKSLGFKLIINLTKQLMGNFERRAKKFTVKFPEAQSSK